MNKKIIGFVGDCGAHWESDQIILLGNAFDWLTTKAYDTDAMLLAFYAEEDNTSECETHWKKDHPLQNNLL